MSFNISIELDPDFTKQIKKLKKKYREEMATLNGLNKNQLNYVDFIDNFIDKQTVADASIDGNANVSHKDIVTLENEMTKPHSKLLAFNKIYYEFKKVHGKEVADEWLENEWVGFFYLHDAYNSTYKPYCYAYDIQSLVDDGLFFIERFHNKAPAHLTTFTDFVGEFTSYNSNRTSGAVGLPSFLVYSYYFWKKDVETNYLLRDPEYYRRQSFQEIIYRLNQPYLRDSIQSAFSNFTIFDREYLIALFGGKEFPDGTFIIDYIDEIIDHEKAFMEVVSDIREQNMMTFPVLTYALLRKDGKFVDEEFAKWCCRFNMKWADSNFFISDDVTSLSNCCRLKSDIKDLGYFNSLGGTALEVGSVKVNTINLARIAYETNSEEEYLAMLKDKTVLCMKTLEIIRHIIQRNIEKKLLPNYDYNLIKMKSQYNTIGIIGIYEVLDKFGYVEKNAFGYARYTDDGIRFATAILDCIKDEKAEFAKGKDYMINIEQIPGERAAHVLMQKDKLIFPSVAIARGVREKWDSKNVFQKVVSKFATAYRKLVNNSPAWIAGYVPSKKEIDCGHYAKYELPLYGNQWIPLGVKTTLSEKVRISAILDKACSGGSIAHINIEKPFEDFDVAWKNLNYIADAGVTYFAYNLRISACKNNHGFFGDTCPICGEKKVTTYQRIVGFLTPEVTYSKPRKEEFVMRDWFDTNGIGEM